MNMQNQRKRSYDCNDGNSELNTEDLYQINHTGEPCHKLHGVKVLNDKYLTIRFEMGGHLRSLIWVYMFQGGTYRDESKHLYCRVSEWVWPFSFIIQAMYKARGYPCTLRVLTPSRSLASLTPFMGLIREPSSAYGFRYMLIQYIDIYIYTNLNEYQYKLSLKLSSGL